MGKGDKRTRKGKIVAGSFGNTRPKPKKKAFAKPADAVEEKPTRKRKAKAE